MTIELLIVAAQKYNKKNGGSLGYAAIQLFESTDVLGCRDRLRLVDFCTKLPRWTYFSQNEDGDNFMDEENHEWIVTAPDKDGDCFLMQQ